MNTQASSLKISDGDVLCVKFVGGLTLNLSLSTQIIAALSTYATAIVPLNYTIVQLQAAQNSYNLPDVLEIFIQKFDGNPAVQSFITELCKQSALQVTKK